MKVLLIASISIFILSCATQVKESSEETKANDSSESIPTTCKGAIQTIANELDEDSVKTLKETKREDLVMFHFSWGMGIRNSYGLWSENSAIRLSCAEQIGEKDIHPDNASGIIMEGVWELVNGANM
ncbi:DUF6794 domain-containing protein [Agaribacterium sp. ZY112]|uniref:DUF6794 domain-containing protein n=1 Tax=Agaribacterium sp. ZY112 TaxID=3233574 RepID=UPI003524D3EE